MKNVPFYLLVLVAGLSFACGDDSSSGSAACEVVSACGGSIEGDWNVVGFCADKDQVPEAVTQICKAATLDSDSLQVSGHISFKSDHSFTQTSTVKGTGYLVLDASCLQQGGVTLKCSQIEELINKSSGTEPVTCESRAGGCRCALAVDQSGQDEGTYSVTGTKLSMQSDKAGMFDGGYCVKGNALTVELKVAATDGMSDDSYELAGQLKLDKR